MRDRGGQLLTITHASLSTYTFVLALLAGFVASVAMVMAFAVAFVAALVIGRVPVPVLADWFRALTSNRLIDIAGPNLYAATAIFFIGGLIWAGLFAIVEPRLHGSAWERGVQFALVPWLFSLIVFMPLVGGGLFGFGLGAGPLPVFGNLILHAVYGAVLGTVWRSAESVIDRPLRIAHADDLLAGRLSEIGAARGLGIGLALGIVLGIIGAVLVPEATGAQALGMNPLAAVVAVGITGAAFGGFVGSLSTS
jgi:hypothetical protein